MCADFTISLYQIITLLRFQISEPDVLCTIGYQTFEEGLIREGMTKEHRTEGIYLVQI